MVLSNNNIKEETSVYEDYDLSKDLNECVLKLSQHKEIFGEDLIHELNVCLKYAEKKGYL